jgi:hypothetical protein
MGYSARGVFDKVMPDIFARNYVLEASDHSLRQNLPDLGEFCKGHSHFQSTSSVVRLSAIQNSKMIDVSKGAGF